MSLCKNIRIFTTNYLKLKSLVTTAKMHTTVAKTSEQVESQKINISGQTINYIKVGTGSKHLLCFPGALGTIWSDFKPQVEGFDRNRFTVVVWDPPGYGGSRPPNRKFDVDFYEKDAEFARKLMEHLDIKKYSLLGWSDGGNSSMILAAKHPQNIEKLVIWGANSYIVKEELAVLEKLKDLSNWSEKMKAPLIALYTEKGLEEMWSSWYETFLKLYENGGNVCKDILKDIKCPTFILNGDKDPVVAPEHPGYLFDNIKSAKIYRYPDGKHNIHLKYAEDFNKRVTEFLLQ